MTENELKDEMYQKLSLYSNELEDRIDDLNKLNTTLTIEIERLHSIIKEVREYIVGYIISDEDAKRDLRLGVSYSVEVGSDELGKLLEILDKVEEK